MGDRSVVWSGVLVGQVVDDGGSSVQCLGVRVGLCGAGVGLAALLSLGVLRGRVVTWSVAHEALVLVAAQARARSRVQVGRPDCQAFRS